MIIASYSLLRPFKTSIFFSLVGREYQPITKFLTVFIMIPTMLFYSKLVDKLKRSYLVHVFLLVYAAMAIVFAILLTHPVIGLQNTSTNPNRILGWAFYLFMDLYSPLILSTFWAFANSINSPSDAKKNYGYIVAVSRIGGIIAPLIGWGLINKTSMNVTTMIPLLMSMTAIFLVISSLSILNFTKKVPKKYLSSYESKQLEKTHIKKKKPKTGMFEGLRLMTKHPYVLGIFGLVYIYEIISVVLDYQMQVLISIANNNAIAGMSSYMLLYTAAFQTIGLVFAVVGTSSLLKKFDVAKCLMIMPITTAVLMIALLWHPHIVTIFVVMVLLRSLHYGFNTPVREILYIPTVKDIKFKSKSWIDSFGRTGAKTTGSTFNLLAQTQSPATFLKLDSIFSLGLTIVWGVISIAVGKKYNNIIENNEIVGVDKPQTQTLVQPAEITLPDTGIIKQTPQDKQKEI